MNKKLLAKEAGSVTSLILIILVLTIPFLGIGLGDLLNPVGGVWNGMLYAEYPEVMVIDQSGYSGVVYRDELAIPHIFTARSVDLGYIVGYLQAYDRLFSIDMQRRQISGWLSEILGAGTNNANLESDKLMRLFGFRRLATELWNQMLIEAKTDPEMKEIVDVFIAYSAGVNRFIADCLPNKLPLEYVYLGLQPINWHPIDTLTLAKYMSFALCYNDVDLDMTILAEKFGKNVTVELVPNGPYDFEDVVIPNFTHPDNTTDGNPYQSLDLSLELDSKSLNDDGSFLTAAAEQAIAIKSITNKFDETLKNMITDGCSNNWVVNGSLTDTGYPILCGDPHLPLMVPSIWWCMHAVNTSNPEESFYGVSFPGTPIIQIGFNQKVAWSATVTAVDVTDFYYEIHNGTHYLWNNSYTAEWRPLNKTTEIINVKNSAPVSFDLLCTKHDLNEMDDFWCPIIPSDLSGDFHSLTNISIKSTYMMPNSGILKFFMKMPRAQNVTDYLNALEPYAYPGQNFIFADIAGNIALYPKAFYPIRNATGTQFDDDNNYRGRYIMNGSTGKDEWTGYIPFEWIPHKVNPDQMYLASANQRTVNTTEYPYYMGYAFEEGYRGMRINMLIREKISAAEKISVEDMKDFQHDVYDIAASVFIPELLDAAEQFYGGLTTNLLNDTLEELIWWNNSANSMQYQMFRNLSAPTIFDHWLNDYQNLTFSNEWIDNGIYGEARYPQTMCLQNLTINDKSSKWFNLTGNAGENATYIMLKALNETIEDLTKELGNIVSQWNWSRVHIMKIEYLQGFMPAFDYPTYGCDGSRRTLNVAGQNSKGEVKNGPSERMIVDFAKLVSGDLYPALLTIPSGQNGNPASSHYSDIFQYWKNYDYPQSLFPRNISAYPTNLIYSRVYFS
ncbi:MAG: penicillin acylase family protein [Candidatus Lokiarchaeota archaeon]|nr:penicillin acylase family protein [Candidatus Lokiarchaeota archaeon]